MSTRWRALGTGFCGLLLVASTEASAHSQKDESEREQQNSFDHLRITPGRFSTAAASRTTAPVGFSWAVEITFLIYCTLYTPYTLYLAMQSVCHP